MSKIDTIRLDDVKVSDESRFIMITSTVVDQEEQEMRIDLCEVERLRDWLSSWLDGK